MSLEPIYLKDYQPAPYQVKDIRLNVELQDEWAEITAQLQIEAASADTNQPLVLDGEGLSLISLKRDGVILAPSDYEQTPVALKILRPAQTMHLEITVRIEPQHNTALSGLYMSKGQYCTQCEPHGFRRIMYFIDRPDNLSIFTVRIAADKARYPHLLSNGNCIEAGDLAQGRHYTVWHDPFKKPAYLFALVAGKFAEQRDTYQTLSGKVVQLAIYVELHQAGRSGFAMHALKAAMAWDERVYGLEYDLDNYFIVAVSDFNMGAMENKGLNIFNDKYILADDEIATDRDFEHILAVVGHEYFHNWSGNRVTLRDWFQLSLKEGFTVFREQCFTEEHTHAGLARVETMQQLQTRQFAEDQSPLSHPVRPASYVEMNNFYTATVYEKGAEIIRMLHTLLGPTRFQAAAAQYFKNFDGQAATVEDFLATLQQHTELDLTQFAHWYDQSGTPIVTVDFEYNVAEKKLHLQVAQQNRPTADQTQKHALHIPIRLTWIDETSRDRAPEQVVSLTTDRTEFVFEGIDGPVIPSVFRQFSAPVEVKINYTPQECFFLILNDNDACARYQAFTTLCQHEYAEQQTERLSLLASALLQSESQDYGMMSLFLSVPSEDFFVQTQESVDVERIIAWREAAERHIARANLALFEQYYLALDTAASDRSPLAIAKRQLQNLCLHYLVKGQHPRAIEYAQAQYQRQQGMTPTLAALRALMQTDCAERKLCLDDFYTRWQAQPLVVDKWLALQALDGSSNAVEQVAALARHPAFSYQNPNKVYSLFLAFAQHNFAGFHRADGAGYALMQEAILRVDPINPQVAARLIRALTVYRRFDTMRAEKMRDVLRTIAQQAHLSKDVAEIIQKSL